MKRIAAWVLAASMAIAVLAGCGSKATDNSTTPATGGSTTTPAKAEPQVLDYNLSTEPKTLDSAVASSNTDMDVLFQTQEGLVRVAEGGVIKQGTGLAESWTVSDDKTVYTFKLRDAKWSDGKAITSQDFKYAWLRALDPKTASEYNYQMFYIKGAEDYSNLNQKDADFAKKAEELKAKVAIETPDAKTLKVTLVRPTPWFDSLMSFVTFLPQRQDIVEKYGDKYGADADKLAFSGPFTIKTWQHDAEIVLVKNAGYWDAANVKLQTVNMKMVLDSNTAVNMFEANQLDMVGIPGALIPQYKDQPGFKSTQYMNTWWLSINASSPTVKALGNVHIRKALMLAIDTKVFTEKVMANGSSAPTGLVPNTVNLQGQNFRKAVGDLQKTTADPAAAKAELAAGLKDLGLDKLPKLEFLTNTQDTAKKYAQGIQNMVQQNLPGVELEIVPVSPQIRLDRIKKGDFALSLAGWGADYDDPSTFLDLWTSDNSFNQGKWKNAEYDKLIKTAKESADAAVRLDALKKAETILANEAPIIPLYYVTGNSMRRPFVKGYYTFGFGPEFELKYTSIEGKAK